MASFYGKRVSILFLFLVMKLLKHEACFGQSAGDYQTNGDVTFTSQTNWQKYNGTSWSNATTAPSYTDGVITIRNGHTASVTTNVTLDQVVIQSGGTFSLNTTGVTPTINDGTGYDLEIQSGGTYIHGKSSPPTASMTVPGGNGSIIVRSGGKIRVDNAGGGDADKYANDEIPSFAPRITWENNAVFDWAVTVGFATQGRIYFPGAVSNVVPIFRLSKNQGATGGGQPTTFNGILEANANIPFANGGNKIFRNGIRGTGSVTQDTGCGQFIINGMTAELDGSGTINLNSNGNFKGMEISSPTLTTTSGKIINSSVNTTVTFSGTTTQQIISTGGTLTFGTGITLAVNNANNVSLQGPIATNNLDFSAGKLLLNANNLTVSGSIANANGDRYIVTNSDKSASSGFLIRNVGAMAVSFPVGSGTSYTPITINSSATTTDFKVRVFDGVYINGNAGNPVNEITDVVKKTWEVVPSSGTTASATFNWNNSDEGGNFVAATSNHSSANLFSNSAPNNTWGNPKNGSITTGNPNSLTINDISSFSRLAIGGPFTPLPVTFRSFTGRHSAGNALLEWTTISEKNNEGFEVERSFDARNFEQIGFVQAVTVSKPVNQYDFTDDGLGQGHYYRLRQLDTDGQYSFSKIIFVAGNARASLSPNPAIDRIHLTLPTQNFAILKLFSANGLLVKQLEGSPTEMETQLNGYLTGLPAGVYAIQVRQDSRTILLRMLKQ